MTKVVYRNSDGVRRTMVTDRDNPHQLTVHTEVVMDDILKGIDRDRENIKPFATNKVLARVPMTIFEQSILEEWDDDRWKKWLNDPDNSVFRVWGGRV